MKLQERKADVTNIGSMEELRATIGSKNQGLALKLVSTSLYSNPIGSFIREITSNAVDANVDADQTAPVMVHMYEEDDLAYVEIKDTGTGMSPDVFKNIYMSVFESDKRNTNDKIGGWGLGSKSPMAYLEQAGLEGFEIITRSNGIQYEYYYADEGTEYKATPINESPTDQPNGTTIRIPIKEADKWKVSQEIESQLAYFQNVYVKNECYWYDNDFKLYDGGSYFLRNKDRPYEEMHICLGQVSYPIDWATLDMKRIKIPVAVKFNVGELPVTLSREAINYKKEYLKFMKERIKEVHQELLEKYQEQLGIEDLFEFIKQSKSRDRVPLKIADVELDMSHLKYDFYFAPFDGLRIKSKDIMTLFNGYSISIISNSRRYHKNYTDGKGLMFHLYRHPELCYIVHDRWNNFDTLYINNGYAIKKTSLTKSRFLHLAEALGLLQLVKVQTYGARRFLLKPGAIHKIRRILTLVDEYLINNIQKYDGIAPPDWVREQKEIKQKEKELKKDLVTHYTINNKRLQDTLEYLLETYTVIFYLSKQDNREKIYHYHFLFDKLGNHNPMLKQKALFTLINPTTINRLKKHKSIMPAENLFKIKSYHNFMYRLSLSEKYHRSLLGGFDFWFSSYYKAKHQKVADKFSLRFYKTYYDKYDDVTGENNVDFSLNLLTYFKDRLNKIKPPVSLEIDEADLDELIDAKDKYYLTRFISNAEQEVKDRYFKEMPLAKHIDEKYRVSNLEPTIVIKPLNISINS